MKPSTAQMLNVSRYQKTVFQLMPSSYLYHKDPKTSNKLGWYILITVFIVMFLAMLYLKIFSNTDTFYEKSFYEKISSISIPISSEVIESFDNGEFWTATSFRINKDSMAEFIRRFNFKISDSNEHKPTMFAETAFKIERLEGFSKKYYNSGSKGKNSWFYIVDPKRSILWAEIQYPDWGGD